MFQEVNNIHKLPNLFHNDGSTTQILSFSYEAKDFMEVKTYANYANTIIMQNARVSTYWNDDTIGIF